MDKIVYRFVYNRKKRLNKSGKALLQLEALLHGKRCYFSTHLYLKPSEWSNSRQCIVHHPLAKELNMKLSEQLIETERTELQLWRQRGGATEEVQRKRDCILSIEEQFERQ